MWPLPPPPLGRSAAVVRLAGDVPDREHLYPQRLEGAGSHVAARAVALELDVHTSDALIHRLVRHALSRHLGRVRGALAAPLEAQSPSRFPGYDVALLVAHADDGVVERALYVYDAGRYVPADPAPRPRSEERRVGKECR